MKISKHNSVLKKIIRTCLVITPFVILGCQDLELGVDSNSSLQKSIIVSYSNSSSSTISNGKIVNNESYGFVNLASTGDLEHWAVWIGIAGNPPKEVGGSTFHSIVGTGFNFIDYFSADWNGDGYSDLICRNAIGGLYFFPFNKTTYKYPNASQGINVGNGFNFTDYLVADWTGDGKPDLIGRNSSGSLLLYPFINNTFIGNGGGQIVGTNFNYTHYFIADWNGNGIADLICRNSSGSLYFFPFANNTFSAGTNVGNGFNSNNYYIGEWTGNNLPDLVTNSTGTLRLYPFRNNTFIGNSGGAIIGTYPNYREIFTKDISGDGLSDLVICDQTGQVRVAKFYNGSYSTFYPNAKYWNYDKYFQTLLAH